MAAEPRTALRAARDRLVDVLGLGDTYPLTDLDVPAGQLKVAFGGIAKIRIVDAQIGVDYHLFHPKGVPLGDAYRKPGSGTELTIESPVVNEDVTYRILATKLPVDATRPAPRFLNLGAPVKVGIDTALPVKILNATPPDPAHPWIVAYDGSVDVQIDNTQEGVQYSLVLDEKDLSEPVRRGNLGAVVLSTGPRKEDTLIQVRATKTFLPSENRVPEKVLLGAKRYLGVMANPDAALSVDDAGVVNHLQDATIRVTATQASAKYLAYVRLVPDEDFVRDAPAGPTRVPAAGKPGLQVKKPEPVRTGSLPQDWKATADPATGGSELVVRAEKLTDDVVVVVRAIKQHIGDPSKPSEVVKSGVWLNQAAVALVRPNPAVPLHLRALLVGDKTGGTLQVYDGQPGVFYYFRVAPAGTEFPLPAYFHKRNAQDTQNKGIGEGGLAIGIDFVITDDPPTPPADRAAEKPQPPRLSITPLPMGSSLKVRAVKAQTGIEVAASDVVISPEPAAVPSGGSATPKPGA